MDFLKNKITSWTTKKTTKSAPSSTTRQTSGMESQPQKEIDKLSEYIAKQGPFDIDKLPVEILEQILSKLSEVDLLMKASCVCKYWKDVIDRQSVWRLKCDYENLSVDTAKITYREAYFKDSIFRKNLIMNPYAIEGLNHWTATQGENGFKIEKAYHGKGVGIRKPDSLKLPADVLPEVCSWVTTYYECSKYQLIDLIAIGFTEKWLDEMEASIHISEWYAPRYDCGCIYQLEVNLLDKEKNLMDQFKQVLREPQWSESEWKKVSHEFPCERREGLRYIKFIHFGKDTQFWAGHYGSKFTGASVKFDFKALHV